jgi:hypothetical protein
MVEVAQSAAPTVRFDGIDIDKRMYPNTHPANMSFHVGSVLALPSDWTSKYDIIHQRLLLAGLQRPQWKLALKELYRVLKPGGWIQLVEVDLANMGVGPESVRLAEVEKALFALKDLDLTTPSKLPGIAKDVGFIDVQIHDCPYALYGSSLANRKARENMYRGHLGLKPPVIKVGGLGYVKDEADFDKMMKGSLKEWEEIRADPLMVRVVCAQKPYGRASLMPKVKPSTGLCMIFVACVSLLLTIYQKGQY